LLLARDLVPLTEYSRQTMRYFAELAYNGAQYIGWQKQPNGSSIQTTVEKGLSKILRQSIEVVGCGRTDAKVHAKQYFLHFDFETELPEDLLFRLNKVMPKDISFCRVLKVEDTAHARFDATHRAYEYHLEFHKNPFEIDTVYYFSQAGKLDREKMQDAAKLLLEFKAFFTFCKSNNDARTMNCDIMRSEWVFDEEKERMIFHISANRFLRGMVRLIVGMCLNVGLGKVSLDEVRTALEKQERLNKSLSVPPHGLYLMDIRYPFIEVNKASDSDL